MYEILFQYGILTVRTFNIFLALSFLFAVIFLLRYIQRKKMNLSFLARHFFYFLLITLLFARVAYVFENLEYFRENPLQSLYLWDFSFSQFGAFFGAFAGLYYFARKSHEDFWLWLDAFVLSGLVALVFVHAGHFFNGTDYGIPTDLPWGVSFESDNIPFLIPIHPTQLYSLLATFVIFALMMRYNRRTHLTGLVGTLAALLYSLAAFGIDFLHGIPSTYDKAAFLVVAVISFVFYVHTSSQKLIR